MGVVSGSGATGNWETDDTITIKAGIVFVNIIPLILMIVDMYFPLPYIVVFATVMIPSIYAEGKQGN